MILTKEDLKYYLEEDRKAYRKDSCIDLKSKIRCFFFHDYNYEYMRNLRKWEYYLNTGGVCDIFMLGAVNIYKGSAI